MPQYLLMSNALVLVSGLTPSRRSLVIPLSPKCPPCPDLQPRRPCPFHGQKVIDRLSGDHLSWTKPGAVCSSLRSTGDLAFFPRQGLQSSRGSVCPGSSWQVLWGMKIWSEAGSSWALPQVKPSWLGSHPLGRSPWRAAMTATRVALVGQSGSCRS